MNNKLIFHSSSRIFSTRKAVLLLFALCSILQFSCKTSSTQARLTSNKIDVQSGQFDEYELSGYIRQEPNKKILIIIPFHLRVYQMASMMKDRSKKKAERIDARIAKKQSKNKSINTKKFEKKKQRSIRKWLMETIGEAPVYLDSSAIEQSVRQMDLYLKTTGHFHAKITTDTHLYSKGRKAKVTYHVDGGTPFIISSVEWEINDDGISGFRENIISETTITEGMQYNEDILDAERDRISNFLRNNGFYHFSKSFIVYSADTSGGDYSMKMKLIIKPFMVAATDGSGDFSKGKHPRSKVGNVYFHTDFLPDGSTGLNPDTNITYIRRSPNDTIFDKFYILHTGKLFYKPQSLVQKCFLRPGDILSIQNAVKTNNGLSSLSNFRYINIRFVENGKDSSGFHLMDVHIDLTRLQKQTFTTEIEGTNAAGNLGFSGSISYKNRNSFRGAEMFSLKLKGAIEAQKIISSETNEQEDQIIESLPFNTIEAGLESELLFPRFLIPYSDRLFSERNTPKTLVTAGVFFQQRPDYTRFIGNISMTYEWKETAQKHHMLSPIFINLVRIFPDSLFAARIEQFSRPLQTSYKDHLIGGARWTYTYTNQKSAKAKNYRLIRTNVELAGNLSRYFSEVFAGAEQGQTFYIFGIRFAQYAKGDIDFRQYFNFNEKNSLVTRTYFGLGVPYGNIDVLPFDKRYSAGGSNDIRAWKFRSLGPGSYSDSIFFDKTGDICLIGNIEYRFPIYDILQSAIFIDAGNIWMLKKYDDYPGGEFKISEFYKQIALGAGMGIRLNFGYFIFRLDAGFPLHDPASAEGERWLSFQEARKRMNLNFGIGYPF